jgi:aryl-phospho-beta-D-glucosidase BglC (GH1 family)
MRFQKSWLVLTLLGGLVACGNGDTPPHLASWSHTVSRVTTDRILVPTVAGNKIQRRPYFRDSFGRYVHFRGMNLSGSIKFPHTENFPDLGQQVSYVAKPFPLEEADKHFSQLQRMGVNSLRFLVSWEAIQPDGPDEFDEAYLDYVDELIVRARAYGIYILLDMHQDIFSRHLFVYYNKYPEDEAGTPFARGSLESQVMSLVPPYSDWVRGDGAPRWVVQTCLPEKRMDSPAWGIPRLLYNMGPEEILAIANLLNTFMGGDGGPLEIPTWVDTFFASLPKHAELPEAFQPYDVRQSNDFLPFTFWGVNGALSVDSQRCFACLLAGDKVTPNYKVNGMSVKDYLQDQYAKAFVELAKRAKHHDNVIGYDIMNEPVGAFITYAAVALYFETGLASSVETLLTDLLGDELGPDLYQILTGLQFLPPDTSEETKALWGFDQVDAFATVDLNINFDARFLQPFYERVGKAIQDEDPNAIIWFETSSGLSLLTGEGGTEQWAVNMTQPEGINQSVYAPHWYPDIYPFIGFNQPPRDFGANEWRFRDFSKNLETFVKKSTKSFNNIPVVFGEFGTYFNYGGIDASIDSNYRISAQILDNYYRAFEALGVGHMQWCVSPENSYESGEGWNLEDFSVIDPDLKFRAWEAWLRPHARATSGKLIETHFYSPHHPYEPEKGVALPVGEFTLRMEGKETDAPTEVFVPLRQYPDGFYVWLSDGYAYFDDERRLLTWYPVKDAPGTEHDLRILPPRPGADVAGWDYFFASGRVIDKQGGVQ